ncbi:hypothetical protein [Burkholderia cenocepacia]|uniref:hypothetical protein n=1 Tax=Burkholderia cenocepacia TaxID=95486 RepID=UPI00264ABA2D|nr:hypothetical protein [Burkholderia cenocepacia]ELW9530474.1 hypothetical protein [Burkholderia cenocepacia]MDN7548105.1 hypothetical protein [Burkholderia cenocepacia]MDN7629222.1 hypothetical protein [Burkholderia cenocepacia]
MTSLSWQADRETFSSMPPRCDVSVNHWRSGRDRDMFSSGRPRAFAAIRLHAWRNFPADADAARIYTARNFPTRPPRSGRHARHWRCDRQLAIDGRPVSPENRALLPLRQ